MAGKTTYFSNITFNVYDLNSPIKIHRLVFGLKSKTQPFVIYRNGPQWQTQNLTKSERIKRDFSSKHRDKEIRSSYTPISQGRLQHKIRQKRQRMSLYIEKENNSSRGY
jgi:hypothetical protein